MRDNNSRGFTRVTQSTSKKRQSHTDNKLRKTVEQVSESGILNGGSSGAVHLHASVQTFILYSVQYHTALVHYLQEYGGSGEVTLIRIQMARSPDQTKTSS